MPALFPREAPAPHPRSLLPSWSLHVCAPCARHRRRVRGRRSRLVFVTKSFRVRRCSTPLVTKAHNVMSTLTCSCCLWNGRVLRHLLNNLAVFVVRVATPCDRVLCLPCEFVSSCSPSASKCATRRGSVCATRQLLLAWYLMVSRYPRHVSPVLIDRSVRLVEPFLWFGFSPCLRLPRALGTPMPYANGHRSRHPCL